MICMAIINSFSFYNQCHCAQYFIQIFPPCFFLLLLLLLLLFFFFFLFFFYFILYAFVFPMLFSTDFFSHLCARHSGSNNTYSVERNVFRCTFGPHIHMHISNIFIYSLTYTSKYVFNTARNQEKPYQTCTIIYTYIIIYTT